MATRISRPDYAAMYGPTTGDRDFAAPTHRVTTPVHPAQRPPGIATVGQPGCNRRSRS